MKLLVSPSFILTVLSALVLSACVQKEDPAELSVTPAMVSFDADGRSETPVLTVVTNQDSWDYSVLPEDNGWLTAVKEGNTLTLSAEATDEESVRAVELTFTAGTAEPVTVTVSQEALILPSYAAGDFYPDEENPVGIVFWIDPESSDDGGKTGKHGKIISMKQSQEGLPYVVAYTTLSDVGADSDNDGAANCAAIAAFVEANPDAADFGAYNWVVTEFGEPWYLPAKEELRTFWTVLCGLTPEQIEIYNQTPVAGNWNIYMETRDYRDAFDQKIEDLGGDKVDFLTLWTSTRYDDDPVWLSPWYVDFGGGAGCCTTQAESNLSYVRAARTF